MMMLHLLAFTGFGPAVEFGLQAVVGSGFFGHGFSFGIELKPQRAQGSQGTPRLNWSLSQAHEGYATFAVLMGPSPQTSEETKPEPLYCPQCAKEVTDPLTCGDCSAVICRRCGTPL